MKTNNKRYFHYKLVVETDFAEKDGRLIELVRRSDSSLGYLVYEISSGEAKFQDVYELRAEVLAPSADLKLMRNVRLPKHFGAYSSVPDLLQEIDAFFSRCLDLDPKHRFILACFVLSAWMVDELPLAPYIALVGLPQSGKTTALKALHLLCRKGILTSDMTSAAFYRACDQLTPTLCIDETATAGQQRALFHLLRSGNTPDSIAFRQGQSYRTFCPKVTTWIELPDDDALNSRSLIIPMRESSRSDLLRTTDPAIVAAADALQGKLLHYRCRSYHRLQLPQISGAEKLRSRSRDLFEALALAIGEDVESCTRLLECMAEQSALQRQSLAPHQSAILQALFQAIHLHPDQGTFVLQDLANNANVILKRTGESFRVNSKGVSTVLTTLGFHHRTRKNSGWVVWLDRIARRGIHELLTLHGVDGPADDVSAKKWAEQCEFCKISNAEGNTSAPEGNTDLSANEHERSSSPSWGELTQAQRDEKLASGRRAYWDRWRAEREAKLHPQPSTATTTVADRGGSVPIVNE